MSAACVQVLATAELLEAILLALPARDLLLSRRVCKTWRHAVKASVKAQRALFRRPQPATTTSEPPVANPFLHRAYGGTISLDHDQLRRLDKKGARRMFVCQPPVKRVEIYGRLSDRRGRYESREVVREGGVKVKHLVRRLEKMPPGAGWLQIVGSKEWRKV